ncbi:hypothetical protein Patl1_03842 [Pistacia atlantica]|uniref:Uncharacterized protein n=1 Tax=Pistacia atlantica TaxID=434234 RepID=A0ACC1BVV8_9ROSI|nr:hypothetical protein Patl1_03842 [Pistacia atlantica]
MKAGHEPSTKGRCWNELKSGGMLKWGKRMNVQFQRNYEQEKLDGDNPTQDPVCAMEFKLLKEAMTRMERNMQELLLKKKEDDVALVKSPSYCVMSQNFDHDNFLLPLKEMYTDLMNEKAKIEEQMMEVSHSLDYDDDNFLVPLKETYTDLMNEKAKIEEQMMEVSHSLCAMEVLMEKLKSSVEETNEAESICSNGVEHLVSSSPCFPGNYRGC